MIDSEQRRFRTACGQFGTGVTIVTTHCASEDHGMTANSFMSVSLDPALIAVSISERARMLMKIRQAGRFAVSILPDGMEDLALHFAGKPREDLGGFFDRHDDMPVIKGAVATFVAAFDREVEAGDHSIFIGRVSAFVFEPEKKPLLFFRGQFGRVADTHPAFPVVFDDPYETLW
ncbi:flavin reductase family protein [Inquilinus sp.]|jgi:flavin reductase (DIM6/NTAB) family NADH-FMN oxidoreductase RutF|uniref:flavin reductase family protein n=1 Tax=Inquilinus sp. TaxID=1932117 RepID=UPI003784A7C7